MRSILPMEVVSLSTFILRTIGSPGSLPAMLSGWVTRAWLKKQHPKWLKEMEHEGKLVVYGEEKASTGHGH